MARKSWKICMIIVPLLFQLTAWADCAPSIPDPQIFETIRKINVVNLTPNVTAITSAMAVAANKWNTACNPQNSTNIPMLVTDGTGNVNIKIEYHAGKPRPPWCPSASGCGCGQAISINGNENVDSKIHIFQTSGNGDACAGDFADTLAHEMGHSLQLGDRPTASCVGHIMGPRIPGVPRTNFADACTEAATLFDVPSSGGSGGGGGCFRFVHPDFTPAN